MKTSRNYYKENIILTMSQKERFLEVVRGLLVRVKEVKVELFQYNPDLQVLIVLIGQIIEAKMSRMSLSKVSCALYMVLKKVETWNQLVPRAQKIIDEYQALKQLLIDIKKDEIRNLSFYFTKVKSDLLVKDCDIFIKLFLAFS